MSRISQAFWDKYLKVLDNFHTDAFQETVTWLRASVNRDRFNEGINNRDESFTIHGLVHYNYFRNWPINKDTVSGQVDRESILVYFNENHLDSLSMLDSNKQFVFDSNNDTFFIQGIPYKAKGDSKAAQVKNRTALMFIILSREEISTHGDYLQQLIDAIPGTPPQNDLNEINTKVTELENLSPINLELNLVLGQQHQIDMPSANPNSIGILQIVDSSDSNKVYQPNFTLSNSDRTATFISPITLNETTIIIWPRNS